jgi:transposase
MNNNLKKNTKDELIEEIIKLREEREEDKQKIKDLEWKLNTNMTNSVNSSSTERFKKKNKITNLRTTWNKSKWWQVWHKWSNLNRNENIDEIVDLIPENCEKCWTDLLNDLSKIVRSVTRQIIDLDKLKTKVTDYIIADIKCYNCGFINKTQVPEWINKSVQYWEELKAFSSYMYNHQMPSYNRLQDFFREVVWLNISQTSLCNFNKTWYEKLKVFEEQLKEILIKEELIHADETWVRVDWKNNWIHVNSNKNFTFLFPHQNRWRKAIEEMWILNNFKWNCVTDWLSSYIAYDFLHYLCNIHHLRELTWVKENEKKKWSKKYISFLMKYKKLKDKLIFKWINSFEKKILDEIHIQHKNILLDWKLEYTKFLKRKPWQRWILKKDKWLNLLERLEKKENAVLWFLDDFSIPFDNNLAERDLRMVKTRTKISGCFRSEEWTEWFCRFRSYISTLRKQNIDIYPAIQSIFKWNIFLPEF